MITSIKNKVSLRLAAGAIGVAMVVSGFGVALPAMAAGLTSNQISSILSLLQSFGADQATINNVNSALNGQATPGTNPNTGTCPALSRDLQVGSSGTDVKSLQVFLNSRATTQVASAGAGSPGLESTYFGGLTKAAAMKFQAANNVAPIAGYVGKITRAAIAAVCGNTTPPGQNPPPVTTGTGLTVSASAQPANALAPNGVSRLPFTNFTVTAGNDGDVTLNSVTVQRTGVANDAAFNGVELVDLTSGLQIGISRTLNSNHQATIGEAVVIPRGTSRTFTVAANRGTTTTYAGQIASFSVVAVNTSAVVSGSLPITGASHTINETLTIGSVSTSTSSYVAPTGTSHTQTIGDNSVRFSGVKFTAASSEDLKLFSVRWRQVGSVSSQDIANIVTIVNGTSYSTMVSSDGKYFTSTFPGGILIPKGNSIDVYIQGDLVGSNAANRTVDFDIDKVTDVYFVGQLYGYGVAPSGTYTPWYSGDSFTINAGSATIINKANEVPAANIAVNVSNQVIGGFAATFTGEPVSVQTLKFSIATTSGFTGAGAITSISLVDSNGTVVAGPIDEASTVTSSTAGSALSFTDTVTFPVGRHVYTFKAKIPSGVANNSTLTVYVDPTQWSSVTGQTSGNTVSLSSNAVFGLNTMTVKSATTSVTASAQPSSQTIVAGIQSFTFANIQLDASQSGEDVRFTTIPVHFTGTAADLSGCQLFDGTTALTTGTHVINTLVTTAAGNVFTLDNSLTVSKGTIKVLTVQCNVSSGATASDTEIFGVHISGAWSATGITSGVSITPSVTTTNSGTMTIAAGGKGTLTVTVDPSSPSYALVVGGSTGVTVGVLKLHATAEAITLTKLGLSLNNATAAPKGSGNASSTGSGGSTHAGVDDVILVSIYNSGILVGTATFTGTNTSATSTLNTPVTLAKDADTLLTLKADIAGISISASGGIGDVVKVDPYSAEGSGVSSGSTIQSGATAGVAGIQMFKAYPSFTNAGVSCTNSNSCNGTAQVLKKFTIAAVGGPVGLNQIAVKLATSSASVTNLKLFAYTDSGCSNPANVSGTTGGQFGATATLGATTDIAAPTVSFIQSTALQVSVATPLCFVVKGDVTLASGATTWSVGTTVLGDSATTTSSVAGYNASFTTDVSARTQVVTGVSTTTGNYNLVWSDNATTTAAVGASGTGDIDWFNGFYVPGLSSSGF